MTFTKTEIAVLKLFAAKITENFSIREVARLIKKDLKIVYISIKNLQERGYFIEQKQGIVLNYKKHLSDITYIETLRKNDFYKRHPTLQIPLESYIQKSKQKFFTLLIFGSYVAGKETKKSDIDLLAVIPEYNDDFERQLQAGLSLSTKKFHTTFLSEESFRELLQKRDEANVVNECINNHIIIYGSETYYAMLGERDVR